MTLTKRKNKKGIHESTVNQITKVAFYVRVSSDEQAKRDNSIPNQKERLEALAIVEQWQVYKIYADEGFSGKDDNRPAFKAMMRDAEMGKFSIVAVLKVDRFMRNVQIMLDRIQDLKECGVSFVSHSEGIDTSKPGIGKIILALLASIAEFERDRMGERVSEGRERYAKKHEFNSGITSWGYRHITDDEWAKIPHDPDEVKPLLVNDVDALAIIYIFTEYTRAGHYIGEDKLAIRMNKETTYPAPYPDRDKKRYYWTGDVIQRILTNPIYKGGWGTPGWVTGDYWYAARPIVTRELWDLAQETRKNNPKRPRTGVIKSKYQGHLFCSICGRALQPSINHNTHLVWMCKGSATRAYGGDLSKRCKFPRLDMKEIDDRIDTKIQDMMINPEKLKENLEKALMELKNDFKNESADTSLITEQIDQINNQIGIALVNSEEGMYTPEVYKDRLKKLKADKVKLEERRQQLNPDADFDVHQKQITINYVKNMIDGLSNVPPALIKKYVNFVKRRVPHFSPERAKRISDYTKFLMEDKDSPPKMKELLMRTSAIEKWMTMLMDVQNLFNDQVTGIVHPDGQIDLKIGGKTLNGSA
jgi:site-specific DNA recombinase